MAPELSQAALACLVRELHLQLWAAGEPLHGDTGAFTCSLDRAALYYTRRALEERVAIAADYLGTDRPSELAHALAVLPVAAYAQRHRLLGALRILPSGRFFVGADDVYPDIVASWHRSAG